MEKELYCINYYSKDLLTVCANKVSSPGVLCPACGPFHCHEYFNPDVKCINRAGEAPGWCQPCLDKARECK